MKILIGIGHGGKDPGCVNGVYKEKDINLEMGLMLGELLTGCGMEVVLSRKWDMNSSVTDRVRLAKVEKVDLAVDLHVNAGGGTGFEVYRQSGKLGNKSLELAKSIDTEVSKLCKSRGIKTRLNSKGTDYYGFLRENNVPSVILECGFIDSSDLEFISSYEGKRTMVFAYAVGIYRYFKADEINCLN